MGDHGLGRAHKDSSSPDILSGDGGGVEKGEWGSEEEEVGNRAQDILTGKGGRLETKPTLLRSLAQSMGARHTQTHIHTHHSLCRRCPHLLWLQENI